MRFSILFDSGEGFLMRGVGVFLLFECLHIEELDGVDAFGLDGFLFGLHMIVTWVVSVFIRK